MDVFIIRLPSQATPREVRTRLQPFLAPFSIHVFSIDKRQGKTFGKLSILDTYAARRFLARHGIPRGSPPWVHPPVSIAWNGSTLRMLEDREEISSHAVQALVYEESQRAAQRARPALLSQPLHTSQFAIRELRCGNWDYHESHLAFTPFFTERRTGSVVFGTQQAVVLLPTSDSGEQRIYCPYHAVEDIVLGSYERPTITIKLRMAPRFYKLGGGDDLADALSNMTLGTRTSSADKKKLRQTSLNDAHSKVVGTCFVYQVTLNNFREIGNIRSLLGRNPRIAPTTSLSTPTIDAPHTLEASSQLLEHDLTDQRRYGNLPYSLLFQISALGKNAILSPNKIRDLLPPISEIFHTRGARTALAALRRFALRVPSAGPGVEARSLSMQALVEDLKRVAEEYDQYGYDPEDPYQIAQHYQHINLVHKVLVTPAGVYLHGPYPEPTNRVLRKYSHHIDHFVRMVFQD